MCILAVLNVLTRRQIQVVERVIRGQTNAEIARDLCVAYETVRSHRRRLYRRLGIHNEIELLRWAVGAELITLEQIEQDVLKF
jgi:DNA-binding NarL/FixJ family response regulator